MVSGVCCADSLGKSLLTRDAGAAQSSRVSSDARLVPRQASFSCEFVLNDRFRVSVLLGNPRRAGSAFRVRVVDFLSLDCLQLGNPKPNELTSFIELLALQPRIEHSEVRLWVDARATGETPAAVVGAEIAVDELQHEVLLA